MGIKIAWGLLLAIIATPVLANDRAITVGGSYAHTSNSNYGDGINGSVRLEHPLIWDLSIGGEYEYHGQEFHGDYGAFSGNSILGEILYYPKLEWRVQPYVMGGIGWSWWDFARSSDLEARGIKVDLGNAMAEKATIGANYKLSPNWSLNIEWGYFHANVPKNAYYENNGAPSAVLGDDDRSGTVKVGQEETYVRAGVRYSF